MSIQFLDELPTLVRTGNPRKQPPEVVEYLEALKAHQGKWAAWPLERKTKPQVEPGFEVASREGVFYVRFVGAEDN